MPNAAWFIKLRSLAWLGFGVLDAANPSPNNGCMMKNGAATVTSNLKNSYGPVQLWTPAGVRETGLQFLGSLIGDHAKTGIGTRLTTGCVVGAGANLFGTAMPPKVVAPFAWGEAPQWETFALEKFLEVSERVMARRNVTLSPRMRECLRAAHAARWQA